MRHGTPELGQPPLGLALPVMEEPRATKSRTPTIIMLVAFSLMAMYHLYLDSHCNMILAQIRQSYVISIEVRAATAEAAQTLWRRLDHCIRHSCCFDYHWPAIVESLWNRPG